MELIKLSLLCPSRVFQDSDYQALATSEVWDGASFIEGPDLPVPMQRHCQLTLNSTHLFFSDLYTTGLTYLYDMERSSWRRVASPSKLYPWGACGLASSEGKGQEVVVALDGSSEIFSIDSLSWRPGKV